MIAALMIFWISDLFTSNAKCQRAAAAMVIEHLRTHQNAWPKHWNDLQDDYEIVAKRWGLNQTFAQLKRRVGIVWDADPDVLRSAESGTNGEPPFHVIWAIDGSSDLEVWENEEPNQMIWNYLNGIMKADHG